jgi:hypothetical protein
MLGGRGFGRWGFILGTVLMAFGAPVCVTSLVTTIANNRAGLPARREDIAAIAAGAAFMLAGLMLAVLAGRRRTVPVPEARFPPYSAARRPAPAGDPFGGTSRSADLTGFNGLTDALNVHFGLDDYDNPPGSGPIGGPIGGAAFGNRPGAARGQAGVPPQRTPSGGYRNSRNWPGTDRFHPPTITGTRSSGTRRRPPGG